MAAIVTAGQAIRVAIEDHLTRDTRPMGSRMARVTGDDGVRIEVLGPIRVLDRAGRDLTPPGVLQRRLLALLVLQRGRVVTTDVAVDVLWRSGLPRDPVGALQNHVSRLRAVLPATAIESVGDGYRLDASAVEVDCDLLATLLRDEAAVDGDVLAEIDDLLARWQGPAFPELGDVDDGRAESTRLAELRIQAREVCAEQRLAEGATDGLVAELTSLAEAEPLRERPRALLMSALAAAGRHAEALRTYDGFRRRLGDELGIEPSPALAAQHAALLGERPDETVPTTTPTRLPVPVTSLIGRDDLVEDVVALIASHRLVTLVGPGGVGKTRLLVEVGHALESSTPGRPVVLCELALADDDSVESVVATSLGIDRRPEVSLAEQVGSVVGAAELVLLVDNCEHVIVPVAALIERLLTRCPQLRVVATSRERLRVAGEHVRLVPVLAAAGDASPAVRLFVERGRAASAEFAPTGTVLAAVREIVRRLDGLPLAIELAAARLHTHDLAEVAAGLDRRFSLLSSGYRTTARHASLAAAVSWSFDVLDEALQEVFAALSVFAGPFSAADAAAVSGRDLEQITAALGELCERSLAGRTPDRRYAFLETLRAFGAERLAAMGRAEVVGARHAHYFVERADGADRRMVEPGQTAVAELDDALPELHAALGWLLHHGEVVHAGRLVSALLDYGTLRLRPDVLAWAERVAARDPADRSPVAPQVWAAAAYAAWMAGDVAEAGVRSGRALAAAERSGGHVAEAATIRGNFELFEGRLDAALAWYRRAIAAADAAGDVGQRLIASATELLAMAYAGEPATAERADALLAEVGDAATPHAAHAWYAAGEADLGVDLERAGVRLAQAIEIAEQTGAALVAGLAGASKASIEARVGDPAHAARRFRDLIDHWRRAGMWSTQWTMLRSIAGLLHRLGQDRDAAVLLGAIQATEAGHRVFGADEVALLDLDRRLRATLGSGAYEAALAEGASLDGDAAVEHALVAL
jgi:predicted ATPase/DNA-binding SARP family transcriptional activator